MANLPDELWIRIMDGGIRSAALGRRDLCSLSIASRRLRRLSGDDTVWSTLFALDFPEGRSSIPTSSSGGSALSSKALYKATYEKHGARKVAAWKRAVLKEESQVAELSRRIEELRRLTNIEQDKLTTASKELRNLETVRRASVALNVWQPEVVRGRQRQLVEQCTVSIESRVNTLEMEIKLCKQQITAYRKAFSNCKQMLDERKEALASLKYHPVENIKFDTKSKDCTKKQRTAKWPS